MSWPSIRDADAAIALLRRESVWNLGGYDGCLCTHFSILGFAIDVSCRKSSASQDGETLVAISANYGFDEPSEVHVACDLVAQEVATQIMHVERGAKVTIRNDSAGDYGNGALNELR